MEPVIWTVAFVLVLGVLALLRRVLGVQSARERHRGEALYEAEARMHQTSSDSLTRDR